MLGEGKTKEGWAYPTLLQSESCCFLFYTLSFHVRFSLHLRKSKWTRHVLTLGPQCPSEWSLQAITQVKHLEQCPACNNGDNDSCYLLSTECQALFKGCTGVNSFAPSKSSQEGAIVIFILHIGHWGTKKLSNLSKIAQLMDGAIGIWI